MLSWGNLQVQNGTLLVSVIRKSRPLLRPTAAGLSNIIGQVYSMNPFLKICAQGVEGSTVTRHKTYTGMEIVSDCQLELKAWFRDVFTIEGERLIIRLSIDTLVSLQCPTRSAWTHLGGTVDLEPRPGEPPVVTHTPSGLKNLCNTRVSSRCKIPHMGTYLNLCGEKSTLLLQRDTEWCCSFRTW